MQRGFMWLLFYPSVPHNLATTAVERAVNSMDLKPGEGEALKEILKTNLDNANFSFQDKFYRQKTGLPIGSAIGGPTACLVLAQEERKLAERIRRHKPHLVPIMESYVRYPHDSFALPSGETKAIVESKVKEFEGELNTMELNPTFCFTATKAVKSMPVLDIMVTIDDVHGIRTDRYSKPTDERTLLHGNSNHSTHVKSGVALGVGLRMKRLASEDSWCIKNLIEEAWVLLGRGHSKDWIVNGFARALIRPRLEMLDERATENKHEQNIVRCIVPYDRALKFRENFRLLQKEKKALELVQGGEFLHSFQCQLVFKNKRNLRRLILNRNPGSSREREHYTGLTSCNCLFCKTIGPDTTHTLFPIELKSP